MAKDNVADAIRSAVPALSAEQAEALADLADAWTRPLPDIDDATRTAIAEGVAQAKRGEFASMQEVDAALRRPWA